LKKTPIFSAKIVKNRRKLWLTPGQERAFPPARLHPQVRGEAGRSGGGPWSDQTIRAPRHPRPLDRLWDLRTPDGHRRHHPHRHQAKVLRRIRYRLCSDGRSLFCFTHSSYFLMYMGVGRCFWSFGSSKKTLSFLYFGKKIITVRFIKPEFQNLSLILKSWNTLKNNAKILKFKLTKCYQNRVQL
jgi:hypothetical protein